MFSTVRDLNFTEEKEVTVESDATGRALQLARWNKLRFDSQREVGMQTFFRS